MGVRGRHTSRRFTPGNDTVPRVQEAGWATVTVWKDAKNLGPPGFDPRTVQPVAKKVIVLNFFHALSVWGPVVITYNNC
jgi:hypothetical protein